MIGFLEVVTWSFHSAVLYRFCPARLVCTPHTHFLAASRNSPGLSSSRTLALSPLFPLAGNSPGLSSSRALALSESESLVPASNILSEKDVDICRGPDIARLTEHKGVVSTIILWSFRRHVMIHILSTSPLAVDFASELASSAVLLAVGRRVLRCMNQCDARASSHNLEFSDEDCPAW